MGNDADDEVRHDPPGREVPVAARAFDVLAVLATVTAVVLLGAFLLWLLSR